MLPSERHSNHASKKYPQHHCFLLYPLQLLLLMHFPFQCLEFFYIIHLLDQLLLSSIKEINLKKLYTHNKFLNDHIDRYIIS